MNILIVGDIHIKTVNIPDIDILILKLCNIIDDKEPDFIVLLGDILDTFEKINTFELNKAYELIEKISKKCMTYILIGNHDMVNCMQFLTENHWANGLKEWNNVKIVDKVYKHDNEFMFVPYVPNGRFIDALNTSCTEWKDMKCIFAHQEFMGAKMGAIVSEDGDSWDISYPHVISGHLHLNQRPQHNIYYPGSSMQVAYGETQENIVAMIYFSEEDNNYRTEEIELGLSKKKIIYTTLDDLEIPENKSNDKIKMSISGEYEEFKTFKKSKRYKELVSKGINVVFKPKRKEIKIKNEKIQENINKNSNNFKEILQYSIKDIDNRYINETYELVINNKHLDEEILYV